MIAIIVSGSALCAATGASLPAATSRQVPMVSLVDVARTTSVALPAAPDSLAFAGAKEAAAQAVGELTLLRFNAAITTHIGHIRHIAHTEHIAHVAYMAHVAHEVHLERLAQEERQAVAQRAAAAQQAAAQQAAAQRAAAAVQLAAVRQQQPSMQSSTVSPDSPTAGAGTAPSGSPQEIAQQLLDADGQGSQFSCLDALWTRESGWNVYATNPGSGAYGIAQALPSTKMASAGADWRTDATTQIRWGLSYIDAAYGSPCAAWSHEEAVGWY